MGMTKAERLEKQKARLLEMKKGEEILRQEGYTYLAGVDEVGRGPLAGPVVTACVVLPEDFDLLGVDDSKKVTEKRRKELMPLIKEKALAYGLGMASEKVIDEVNILEATKGAMKMAIVQADRMLREKTGEGLSMVLIDAVHLDGLDVPQRSIIKGDATCISIAAASILAKVTRDDMMVEYAKEYPWYAFESNKGYGTAAHYEGIRSHGLCPIHRRSFLKGFREDGTMEE